MLDRHGLCAGDRDARVLGGFVMLGGHGDCPPTRTLCSVTALAHGVLITAEAGARGQVLLPYGDLLRVEVSGDGIIEHKDYVLTGQVHTSGRLYARQQESLLSKVRARSSVDSFLRITARSSGMQLQQWKYPPDSVRNALGRIFVAHLDAVTRSAAPVIVEVPTLGAQPAPSGPIDELERLTKLHAAGALTDTEFELARTAQIRRLHTSAG